MEIKEIYRVNYMTDQWNYVGTLRNEKKFELTQKVFFVVSGNRIARGVIVGVELPPEDNPDYKYKIQIPKDLVKEMVGSDDNFYNGLINKDFTIKCDKMFSSIDEARDSAMKHINQMYDLQIDEINNYFNQWTNSGQ